MIRANIQKILEIPKIYRISQLLMGPGAERALTDKLKEISQNLINSERILDVGCGPSSWLSKINRLPVGIDLSFAYSVAYHEQGGMAVTGTAPALPFADQTFDAVWCIGVLHHLPDKTAEMTVAEMLRACKQGGHVVILDAVMPHSSWRRPLAYLIRRMDRGQYMRNQRNFQALLPDRTKWVCRRYTYAATGLEMLECIYKKR